MNYISRVIFLLMLVYRGFSLFGQEVYNNCNTALEICPNESYQINNIGSNVTFCPGCEDDFNYCFPTDNTIWLQFTSNSVGGNVAVDFTNLVFEMGAGQDNALQATIIQATAPCDASTYTQVGTCLANQSTNFSLSATLNPNTQYYIVIDGDMSGAGITVPAEATMDVVISGPGIDRPLSSLTITESSDSICLNEAVSFYTSMTDCPDNGSFEWYINDSLVAITTDTIFSTSALQDGDIVTVSTTCYSQCPDTVSVASMPVSVFEITIDAGVDLTINEGEGVQLNGYTTAPVYYWSPSFQVSNPNVLNPIAELTETTVFTFTAEENGCVLSDYVTITVNRGLEIPNTFSPNDDGTNDTWIITGIEKYPDNSIKIYDRWGQEIYIANGYSKTKAWGGTTKRGRKATEGVYYYVLDLRNGSDIIKGSITIIR